MTEETRPYSEPLGLNGLGRALFRPWPIAISEGLVTGLALGVILVLAGLLRLTAVSWDNGLGLHPDERHIVSTTNDMSVPGSISDYFDTEHSGLNPYNHANSFVYGTAPVFFGKISASLSGPLGFGERDTYSGIFEVGRTLSALADIGTVLFVFLLAQRLFGPRAGLLAALFYTFSALPIQHSHFFLADPFMTLFAAGTVYYAVRIVQDGRWRDYALAGLMLGLATASKLTAVSLLPVVGLAAGIRALPSLQDFVRESARPDAPRPAIEPSRTFGRAAWGFVLALAVAFVIFRIGQPYAFTAPGVGDLAFWRDDFTCEQADCGQVTEWAGRILNLNPRFVQDQVGQQGLLSGGNWPPNVQWVGRTQWIWPLQQMIVWGMGPALGVAAWLGVFYLAWRAWSRKQWVLLVPLSWVAGYFLFMGGQFTLYLRYFLPLYPTLAVFASALVFALWAWADRLAQPPPKVLQPLRPASQALPVMPRFQHVSTPAAPPAAGAGMTLAQLWRSALPGILRVVAVAVPVATILWGLAYFHIYSKPVTRVEASAWIYANVPDGATVTQEDWDDSLPLSLSGIGDGNRYNHISFGNFEVDSEDKVNKLLDTLDQADYIILASDRLDKTIPRVSVNFPVTTRYYQALFNGDLGFDRVAKFESSMKVLGITIPDSGAEEAWTVYDHPRVQIFKKTTVYSHDRAVAVLDAESFVDGAGLTPDVAGHNGLMLRPDALAKQQEGGTFSKLFNADSVANRVPLWTWLLVVELVSFSVLPGALLLFRALPDRGYLLSKPLGFLILGYLVWLAASLHIADFTRGTIAVVFVLMLLFGAAVAWRTRDSLQAFVREHWRAILLWEALFLASFLIFYLIRISDPDLWHPARGGEKPMDLAYFIAVVKSTTMPPYDPWFAGGYLNYYYFGQMLAATMTKFTGILPEVAYNLSVPLFFSLAVAATYSLAFNLAEATRRFIKRRPQGTRIGPTGPGLAGLGAVLIVLFAGNFGGANQLIDNFGAISPWHTSTPVLGGVYDFAGGMKAIIFDGKDLNLPTDWYWASSRMMPPTGSITEFPYFTFLYADMHAHLMAIPFALTSLAVGAAVVLNATKLMREDARYRRWAGWGLLVVLAFVIGALRWINSWDYPTFLLMGMAAVTIAEWAGEGHFTWPMLGRAALKSIVLALLTAILFYPFSANYELPASGFIRMNERETTPFHQYLAHFGLFLFLAAAFVAFLAGRVWRRMGGISFPAALAIVFATIVVGATVLVGNIGSVVDKLPGPLTITGLNSNDFFRDVAAGILAPLPGASPIAASTDGVGTHDPTPVVAFVLFAFAVLGIIAFFLLRRLRSVNAIVLYVVSMIALALFLTAGVEVAVFGFDIQRMNTVFKFYLHAWILLGVAGSFGAWYLLDVVRPKPPRLPSVNLHLAHVWRPAFATVAAGLVMTALVYPLVATPQRVRDRFDNEGAIQPRTDDGLAYMLGATYDDGGEIALADDYAGIQWMREHVQSSPVILEGVTPLYHWGNRYAINTGLPAVIGWDWHQTQQRGTQYHGLFGDAIQQRQRDVRLFYSTSDVKEAQDILTRYHVKYVILGALERNYWPGPGVENIEDGLGGKLSLVFQAGKTNIYEVQPAFVAAQ